MPNAQSSQYVKLGLQKTDLVFVEEKGCEVNHMHAKQTMNGRA
jgi:hypothetical protein